MTNVTSSRSPSEDRAIGARLCLVSRGEHMEVSQVAKDDIDPEEVEEVEIDLEGEEIDILGDLEDEDDLLEQDDAIEEDLVEEEDEDDDDSIGATIVRKPGEDEDEDEDLVTPDDVEEDLAAILEDRLASEEPAPEEEEVVEWDDRSGAEDGLQPKRADEVLCTSCFLLVRKGAPNCPVGDDACPVFAK